MNLENDYYRITGAETAGGNGVFHIALCPDCGVYRGHFPGNPVCPGVCNIQTVAECAGRLAGRPLEIAGIRRCRMTAVATPEESPRLDVTIHLAPAEDGYDITATVSGAGRTFMELKGTLTT